MAEVKREMLEGRGMVWRCSDCGNWVDSGVVRHSKRCDMYDALEAGTYYPDEGEPLPTPESERQAMARRAKAGDLALHYSEDEVVDAVKRGWISMSDAMNQDF